MCPRGEIVDARGLKPLGGNPIPVRVRSWVPKSECIMDKERLFHDFESVFIGNVTVIDGAKNETWIIKYNGKQLALGVHGKTKWGSIGHAKAALTDKIKGPFQRFLYYSKGVKYHESEVLYKEMIQKMQDKGILEFIKI